jgi:hypothetical protein
MLFQAAAIAGRCGGPVGAAVAPLTRPPPSHISASVVSAAIALILLVFLPKTPELTNSHSFGGRALDWAGTTARHSELIDDRTDFIDGLEKQSRKL